MKTKSTEQAQFRTIKTESRLSLKVLETPADYAQSMHILAENGLRPLTYQEALLCSPELIRELEGKCFYLADQVLEERNGTYTFTGQGELVKLSGNEARDKKVRVWSGDPPLCFEVSPGTYYGWRLNLFATNSPEKAAPVVVGVKVGSKTAAQKQAVLDPLLVEAARSEYERLTKEVLQPGQLEHIGELLRALERKD